MISIAPYLAPSSGIGLRKVKLLRPLSRMPEGILRPSKFSSETVAKTSGQSMKSVNIKLEPAHFFNALFLAGSVSESFGLRGATKRRDSSV